LIKATEKLITRLGCGEVTEFGSADMKGNSSTERALTLIQLAHPKFREDLLAQAKQLHLV
jgi:itaconate CoA-transferase